MSNILSKIEALTHKIPGYSGYIDRERSRDTDKKLREYLARKISAIKASVDDMKSELLEKGILDHLSALDNISSILERLSNSVLYASRGYGGIFGTNKVYEAELEKLHNFDLNFTSSVEELEGNIKNVWETQEKDFSSKIKEARSLVNRLESIWKDRDVLLNGLQ